MTFPFTIRDALVEDADQIVELGISVNITTFGQYVGEEVFREHLEVKYTIEKTRANINNSTIDFVLATTTPSGGEEKIIGFAVLARGVMYPCLGHLEGIIELQRIYIYPEFQGQGVGKALLGELEGRARKEGRKNIWLGCYERNEAAKRVYEKGGYVSVGERSNEIAGKEYVDWIMVKRL